MSGQWKPGDVAILFPPGIERGIRGIRVNLCRARHAAGEHWHTVDGDYLGTMGDHRARPLLVIDPEAIPHLGDFADDVKTALNVIADNVRDIAGGDLDATEQIVRWLADQMPEPPKPDEPQGLGAVVVDNAGVEWVRTERRKNIGGTVWSSAFHVSKPDRAEQRAYADIDAVEVLSEGVTP